MQDALGNQTVAGLPIECCGIFETIALLVLHTDHQVPNLQHEKGYVNARAMRQSEWNLQVKEPPRTQFPGLHDLTLADPIT